MDKLDILLGEIKKVNDRLNGIEAVMATKDEIANLVTKDEVANIITKDDIANLATKDGIANMATKDDIANMATKDDIANLATKADIETLPLVTQAILEINTDVKKIMEDLKSIHEILGEHDVSIRTIRRNLDLEYIKSSLG